MFISLEVKQSCMTVSLHIFTLSLKHK